MLKTKITIAGIGGVGGYFELTIQLKLELLTLLFYVQKVMT
jgi:hypothetical protein